jgi:hypothetical protein
MKTMQRMTAVLVMFTFTMTNLIHDPRNVNLGKLFAMPPSPSSAGSLGNVAEASAPVQSYQTDLFTGRAQMSLPVFMPPGRRGLTPQAALSYSSSGGNGWIGKGWGMEMGFIQRSTKNGVPSYDDNLDKFLFLVQGVNNELVKISADEYHAKDESGEFLKFTRTGSHWVARDKSGATYTFGESVDARQTNAHGIFCWCLEKVRDLHGNTIHYNYTDDQGEMYLSQIQYNGNEDQSFTATHTVDFILETRPDAVVSYHTGAKVTTAMRLKEIQVKVNGALSRKYNLTYQTSPQVGRSRLTSVQECGTDGTTCLPAQTFTYTDHQLEIEDPPQVITIENGSSGSDHWNAQHYVEAESGRVHVATMDVNGDGISDRIMTMPYGSDPWDHYRIQFNTGSSFEPLVDWDFSNQNRTPAWGSVRFIDPSGEAVTTEMADLTGDGRPDRIVLTGGDGYTINLQVEVNNGNGFNSPSTWHIENAFPPYWYHGVIRSASVVGQDNQDLIDMNADGLADRVMTHMENESGQNSLKIQINNSSDFNSSAIWPLNTDIQNYPWRVFVHYAPDHKLKMTTLDINGDGLPDRIYADSQQPPYDTWKVSYNNGSGFEPEVTWQIENVLTLNDRDFRRYETEGIVVVTPDAVTTAG